MRATGPLVASIVGIDGCGKSATFRGALDDLSRRRSVVGIGAQVWSSEPGKPLQERRDIPLSRTAAALGRLAKDLRWQDLYKNLKFVELAEQTRIRDYVAVHDPPEAILTDGQPLINAAAWAAARFYRAELAGGDDELWDVIQYLSGARTISPRALPHYLRHSWQLAVLNLLRLSRFSGSDIVFLLDLDPAAALERIRARGKPLQVHENEAFLGELRRAYARVCRLLCEREGTPVIRIPVGEVPLAEAVRTVVAAVEERIMKAQTLEQAGKVGLDAIEVVATTISGSVQDQRKVPRIEPEFRACTARPVHVHTADSHAEAQRLTHEIVAGGGRLLVSAGGGGTLNAVLEGAHIDGAVPPDLRVAFLRKGSADLIGKVLGIPDALPDAARAIVEGIECGHTVTADILAVEAADPDGTMQRRHLIGFGGFGAFGEVPRISEARIIKYYKGFLGTLFGDLGPFYVAITLSTGWWVYQQLRHRNPPLALTLDDEALPPAIWDTVVILNGDLGSDFPLGRDLALSSGSFRVVALRYQGLRRALRQLRACRSGTVLDQPDRYGALVRTVQRLEVAPIGRDPFMVNVDGLRMPARGPVRVTVSGQVGLVAGWKR